MLPRAGQPRRRAGILRAARTRRKAERLALKQLVRADGLVVPCACGLSHTDTHRGDTTADSGPAPSSYQKKDYIWLLCACRHTEDMDLASVNFLHYGAPKSWYCIPPAHRERFERVLQGLLPDMFRACPEFLRHKVRPSPASCLCSDAPMVACSN